MNAPRTPEVIISEWRQATNDLKVAKEQENRLRNEILAAGFNFNANEERAGTENLPLPNGAKLKAVFKMTPKLDNTDGGVDKALTKMEKSGPEGAMLADRLVKWEPSLSVSEYKKLPEKYQKMIDEVLTFKPGLPSLEYVEPKA